MRSNPPVHEQQHSEPTAIVRTTDGRELWLNLGVDNELPPLLVDLGWRIVRILSGKTPVNGR